MLALIIEWLYPSASRSDYLIRDDGDGPYIYRWDEQAIGSPKPTEAEVLAHEGAWRLDTAKTAKLEAIDGRSQRLLTAGLEVAEGVWISTSIEAQINLSDLYLAHRAELVTLPQGLSTLDGGEYTVTDSDHMDTVAALWAARKKAVLDAGRALRLAVLAAESVEAVEAITDERE